MLLYEELTSVIIGKSYEVMNELGAGFLESVYHKSLFLALQQEGLCVQFEHPLSVLFRGHNVGNFKIDLVIEKKVIVEVKAVDNIIGEHKAQVINYLSASELFVGLIINFGKQKVQTSRLEHPKIVSDII
jgi:GxxExxY protein